MTETGWFFFAVCGAWLWGFLGAREIFLCGSCRKEWFVKSMFLAFFLWPIHWWERRQQQQKAVTREQSD